MKPTDLVSDVRSCRCPHVRSRTVNYPTDTLTLCDSWKSDVNSFPALDSQLSVGPTYSYEYSTRDAYGANITSWGPNDPLNATWWHLVTERTYLRFTILHLI